MEKQTRVALLITALTTLLYIFAPSLSHADTTMYKWIDQNGVVSFSQYPPGESQQATEVDTITIQTMPVTEQRAANRMLLNEKPNPPSQKSRIQQADQAVETALKQLQIAERNLKEGSIPTGEDRVGNVNGYARLRDTYFERVSNLQNEVDKARQSLVDAYNARDGVLPD
jgi:hypothetical protein